MKMTPKPRQSIKGSKPKVRSKRKNVSGKNLKGGASRGKMISLRGIDPVLSKKIKSGAEKKNKSINQFLIDTLKKDFGMEKNKKFTKTYHDLDELFGKWSEKEFSQIQGQIEAQRTIDSDLWQ